MSHSNGMRRKLTKNLFISLAKTLLKVKISLYKLKTFYKKYLRPRIQNMSDKIHSVNYLVQI